MRDLTLRRSGKAPRVPIVLFDCAYWERGVGSEAFIEGMIVPADLQMFDCAYTAEEVRQALLRHWLRAHGDTAD